jgi:hypothetical protein
MDAYIKPAVLPDYSPELFDGKSREERIEELRKYLKLVFQMYTHYLCIDLGSF